MTADRREGVTFDTTLSASGNKAGIPVPEHVIEQLGHGKRPAVLITVNGYQYRREVDDTDRLLHASPLRWVNTNRLDSSSTASPKVCSGTTSTTSTPPRLPKLVSDASTKPSTSSWPGSS